MRRVYSTDKAFLGGGKAIGTYSSEVKQVPQLSTIQRTEFISPGQSLSVPRKIEVRRVASGSFAIPHDHSDVKYRSFHTAILPNDQSDSFQDQRYQLSPFLQK